MAAVCSADMDNTDKVVPLIEECRRMGLKVEPPQVNLSQYKFTIADEKTVVYGLGAIKGVGEGAIEAIASERDAQGAFSDLFEFCRRIDLRRVNRRVLESLVRAGALDGLGVNRASLMLQLPLAIKLALVFIIVVSSFTHDFFFGPKARNSPRYTLIAKVFGRGNLIVALFIVIFAVILRAGGF